MTATSLSPERAGELARSGEVALLDARPAHAFARGHPAGALSVPFSARGLAARARIALSPGVGVVIVGPDEATAAAAEAQLAEAGIDVRGCLDGGPEAWRAAGLPQAALKEVEVDDLPRLAERATVVDVREPIEWTTGHVPGALLVRLGALRGALADIPRDRPIIAICEAGLRSCTAASILSAAGFDDVAHVPEGSSGYRRRGLPLAFPSEEAVPR